MTEPSKKQLELEASISSISAYNKISRQNKNIMAGRDNIFIALMHAHKSCLCCDGFINIYLKKFKGVTKKRKRGVKYIVT